VFPFVLEDFFLPLRAFGDGAAHERCALEVFVEFQGEGVGGIKQNGGYCIAQDEATCVVYGMPKSVVDAGLADEICPLPKIAGAIQAAVRR